MNIADSDSQTFSMSFNLLSCHPRFNNDSSDYLIFIEKSSGVDDRVLFD